MFDLMLLFSIAFAGGMIALIGFVILIGRKIFEPKREMQQKIDMLEKEVRSLKEKK